MSQTPRPRRRRVRNAVIAAATTVTLAAGGGTAWALDRFVVDHVEIADVSAYEAAQDVTGADTGSATGTVTGDTSTSGDASVTVSTVTTGSGDSTVTYHVADVTLPDATVLRSAFAQDAFGTNITEDTSDIAEDNGAVFAVNGDYRGFRDTGIEIRNGVVYRDEGAREGLAFYRDGTVEVYDETTTTADDLVADGAGGPAARGQLRAARRPDRPGDAAAAGQGGHRGAAGGAGYAVQRSLVFRRRAAAPQVPVAPPPRELVLR